MVHKIMSENSKTCEYCSKTFATKGSLTRHKLAAKYCSKAKNDIEEGQMRLLRDELMMTKGKMEVLEKIANRNQVVNMMNANMMNINLCSLYILSTPEYENFGEFKVGIHTGEIGKLISRYITPHPNLNIKLFISLADKTAKELENKIKSHFRLNSVPNINGNNSEWFRVPLTTLYSFICSFLFNSISSGDDEKSYEQYQGSDSKDLLIENHEPSISANLGNGQISNVS